MFTLLKCMLFCKWFQYHEWQLLQKEECNATGPRTIFAATLAQLKTLVAEQICGMANITTNMDLEFQICLSGAETEGTTGSMADIVHITDYQKREIYEIASNEKKWFKKELSIHLIQVEVQWHQMSLQKLKKTVKQHVLHGRYRKIHLVSHLGGSTMHMESGDYYTTNIS